MSDNVLLFELTYKLGEEEGHNRDIKLFNKIFINNNTANCKIIYKNNEYKLMEYFSVIERDYFPTNSFIIQLKSSHITNMSHMFSNCNQLLSINNRSYFDTSNVNDMSSMFNDCSSLISINGICNFNTSNVKNMSNLFKGCSSLVQLPDISKWNIFNVIDISNMFSACISLISLPDIVNWNTLNVIDMSYLFNGCKNLKSLPDFSNWTTINVENMSFIFSQCSSLIKLIWIVCFKDALHYHYYRIYQNGIFLMLKI